MLKKLILCSAITIAAFTAPAYAMDEAKAKELLSGKINTWLNNPIVIDAIKAQNTAHADLSQDAVVALDNKWRGDDKDLIDTTLSNDLSKYLSGVVGDGGGLYSEIFVMDNKGLNVGQSSKTSDYWQGDEAKWQKTYSVGPNAIHLSEVEFDESSQTYQVQLSTTVSENGVAIGAITIGVDAEMAE